MDTLRIGLVGEKTIQVGPELTAQAFGSGDLPVYATPAMVALMEGAAVQALSGQLPEGQSSVGTDLQIKHLAATPLGLTIRARAEITAIDGRRITFRVQAWDDKELIGEGTHVRFIIDVDRFMARVTAKQA